MSRKEVIKIVFKKHGLDIFEVEWLERLIDMPLDKLTTLKGDIIDFTGQAKHFAALIEAREIIAKADL